MFIICVRLAFVTSVMCNPPSAPPVMFRTSHDSIVPNTASPASALARAPGTFSSSQRSLSAEKWVASGRPVLPRSRSCPPTAEFRYEGVGPGILPDDRVGERLARAPVPRSVVSR